jgi:hypothetical protein
MRAQLKWVHTDAWLPPSVVRISRKEAKRLLRKGEIIGFRSYYPWETPGIGYYDSRHREEWRRPPRGKPRGTPPRGETDRGWS